jgi:glycosyltransferase involved in cell wall biosynthesis
MGALEAMACALPVIASEGPSLADAVRPGREGVLVPARDPAALAEAMASLAGDADRRRTMGEAARRRVEEAFSLDRAALEVAPPA